MRLNISITAMALLTVFSASHASRAEETNYLQIDPFGKVYIVNAKHAKQANELVIFMSGDGGWYGGAITMADEVAKLGAFVIGIDIPKYRHNLKYIASSCHDSTEHFGKLIDEVRYHYGIAPTIRVTLAGYSAGASWAYAILTMADSHRYQGAVSLGFCKDIEIDRPLCETNLYRQSHNAVDGNYAIQPSLNLPDKWFDLHGEQDTVCPYAEARDFIAAISTGADFISLPHVGHGFGHMKDWLPQMQSAFAEVWRH